jgi:hypothetical protein
MKMFRHRLSRGNSRFCCIFGDDATYTQIEGQLTSLATQRNALAAQIIQVLENAEFNNQPVRWNVASLLISQAEALLYQIPYAKVTKP